MSLTRKFNSLDIICCPVCKGQLILSDLFLECPKCNKKYEDRDGIYVLIDLNSLPEKLAKQVDYFSNEPITNNAFHKLAEWQKSYLTKFTNCFDNLSNKIVIDCGTGSGYMAIELAKQGAQVIALDLTFRNLVRLKKIAEEAQIENRLTFICCSAEDLPIKDAVVDYFISNAVLEHLPKEALAISEINRVCGSQAGLMITVPVNYRYLNLFLVPLNYLHDRRIGHLRRYDKKSLESKFFNWTLVRLYYTGHTAKVVKILFNTLFRLFDDSKMEAEDRMQEANIWGSSNVISLFKREK